MDILLIGPLPPPIGGTTVSFGYLVEFLSKRPNLKIQVVNSSGIRGNSLKSVCFFFAFFLRILRAAHRTDVVSLHVSATGLPYAGPVVLAICSLYRKPFILRMFGGKSYRELNTISRLIACWVVRRSNLFLAQTRALVETVRTDGVQQVKWYPTSRPVKDNQELLKTPGNGPMRFVYVGQVRPAKGIMQLIEAAERFGPEIQVDVFGPLHDGLTAELFGSLKRVRYCGVISPEQVLAVLAGYEVLLMPTFHVGEGYPGVIIEAFIAGLPVLCTRWRYLPELVDETCGILVEPQDVESLYEGIKRISQDRNLYFRLREGAWKKRLNYSADFWVERFLDYCSETVECRRGWARPISGRR